MLSKLFSKRQKTEPLPEKPAGNYRMVPEEDMEDLYNRAKNLPDGDDKIILLKKAFELYRG